MDIDDGGDGSNFGVDLGDHSHEFVEADGSVSVLIGVVDHLVHFGAGEVLSHAGSHLLELLRAEQAGSSGVESLEDRLESGLAGAISAKPEDFEEGTEVNVSLVAGVVHDGQDLTSLRLHVKSADGVDQLLSGDVAATVVVEHVEHLLQLAYGIGIEALLHVLVGVETLGRGGCRGSRLGHKIFLIQQKIKLTSNVNPSISPINTPFIFNPWPIDPGRTHIPAQLPISHYTHRVKQSLAYYRQFFCGHMAAKFPICQEWLILREEDVQDKDNHHNGFPQLMDIIWKQKRPYFYGCSLQPVSLFGSLVAIFCLFRTEHAGSLPNFEVGVAT